jgi:hypothetical protein
MVIGIIWALIHDINYTILWLIDISTWLTLLLIATPNNLGLGREDRSEVI